jgi:hypothetical protein
VLPVPASGTAPSPENESAIEAMTSPEESAQAAGGLRIQLASAAAWSPNPENPPLYLDLPWHDGEIRPEILAKWTANAPLAFIDQYIGSLRQYNGIYIDVGGGGPGTQPEGDAAYERAASRGATVGRPPGCGGSGHGGRLTANGGGSRWNRPAICPWRARGPRAESLHIGGSAWSLGQKDSPLAVGGSPAGTPGVDVTPP